MLKYCKTSYQNEMLFREDVPSSPDFDELNSIDVIPEEI